MRRTDARRIARSHEIGNAAAVVVAAQHFDIALARRAIVNIVSSAALVRDALDEGQRHGLTAFARLVQAIFDASVGVLVGVGAIEKTEHAQSVRTSRSLVPITPSQGCGGA